MVSSAPPRLRVGQGQSLAGSRSDHRRYQSFRLSQCKGHPTRDQSSTAVLRHGICCRVRSQRRARQQGIRQTPKAGRGQDPGTKVKTLSPHATPELPSLDTVCSTHRRNRDGSRPKTPGRWQDLQLSIRLMEVRTWQDMRGNPRWSFSSPCPSPWSRLI